MSMPPCRSVAVATTRWQSCGLVTSAATPLTVPVSPVRSATVPSMSDWFRPVMTTLTPARASVSAMPRPMPLLPPVTMAERPCSEVNM